MIQNMDDMDGPVQLKQKILDSISGLRK